MAFAKTAYFRQAILKHTLNQAIFTQPSGLWLSLHTANPTDAGSLAAEVSTLGSHYARLDLTGKLSIVDSNGITRLNDWVTTLAALTDWGELSYGGISDAATAGNMLYYGAFAVAQVTTIGQAFQLAPGQLVIQEQ